MECKHYWVCSQPVDGFVQSTCRHCGEVRNWETLVSIEHKKAKVLPNPWLAEDFHWPHDGDHTDDEQLVAL